MNRFLIRKFVKDHEQVRDQDVRKAYGVFSGILGVICNFILFVIKLITGLMINSIAVISDAFNNLSDSGSSLIMIFGANFSNKPPDEEHPYGHGRIEYIGSLIVSFIIFTVGFELLQSSFHKIIDPEPVHVSTLSIVILVLSVLIKFWMYTFNRFVGKAIHSSLSMATAKDSLNDVISTIGVIIGTVIGIYVDFPIDGILGLIISFLILFTGFSTAKDSVHFLLGPSPDPEILDKIQAIVDETKMVDHIHDLHIHDYGPGRKMATMHAVVPAHLSVGVAHSMIHELEQRIENDLQIEIVIHVDPEPDIDEKLQGNGE